LVSRARFLKGIQVDQKSFWNGWK